MTERRTHGIRNKRHLPLNNVGHKSGGIKDGVTEIVSIEKGLFTDFKDFI